MLKSVRLFGVDMHSCTMDETVREIARRLDCELFTQHVVVNVAKIVHMRRDPELAAAVTACDIINIDGAGVVFGGRALGYSIPERVAGIDLFDRLLQYSEAAGRKVYFLGAKPEILEAAVAATLRKYPALNVAGRHHGYFWDDERAVVENIRVSGAELLFVGISSPMKEQFIERRKDELGVKFAMGVGGSFDVVAGAVRRAPRWMQAAGLEWFYRVIQEPRRMFFRYLTTNTAFLWIWLSEFVTRATTRKDHDPTDD